MLLYVKASFDLHKQIECFTLALYHTISEKATPLSSNCRPPSTITAPKPGKILSEPSELTERKTNR